LAILKHLRKKTILHTKKLRNAQARLMYCKITLNDIVQK